MEQPQRAGWLAGVRPCPSSPAAAGTPHNRAQKLCDGRNAPPLLTQGAAMRGRMTAAATAPLCQLRSSVSAAFPQGTISCMAAMPNPELVECRTLHSLKALEPNSHAGSRNQHQPVMRAFGSHVVQTGGGPLGGRAVVEQEYVQKEVDRGERNQYAGLC